MTQPNMPTRGFREWALIIQVVLAAITSLVSFGLPGVSSGVAGAIVAFCAAASGFLTALFVRPIAPSIATGFMLATVALVAAFGVDVPQTWVGAAVIVVQAVVVLVTRMQQSPVRVIDGEAVVITPDTRASDPIATKAMGR